MLAMWRRMLSRRVSSGILPQFTSDSDFETEKRRKPAFVLNAVIFPMPSNWQLRPHASFEIFA